MTMLIESNPPLAPSVANVYKYLQGGRGGSKSPKSRLRKKWMLPKWFMLLLVEIVQEQITTKCAIFIKFVFAYVDKIPKLLET